jgi:hypothetical protein
VGDALANFAPIIVMVGTIVGIVARLFKTLTVPLAVLKPILQGLFEVLKGVAWVVAAVVNGIAWIWNAIVSAVGWLIGKSLSDAKIQTINLGDLWKELSETSFDDAMGSATDAANRFTDAMGDATSSLTNVPTWWKVEGARYAATDPVGAPMPALGAGGAAAPVAGDTNITINVEGAGDPGEVARQVVAEIERERRRRTGSRFEYTP